MSSRDGVGHSLTPCAAHTVYVLCCRCMQNRAISLPARVETAFFGIVYVTNRGNTYMNTMEQ